MLIQGSSLLGQSSRYLAKMTRPVLTKPFKAWSMIVILIPVYDNFIAIPSFVCPKLTGIELLNSLRNDWHLFADGFVTVRPIAMQFGWDQENVSSLKFRKFHLNPTNFNRKLTMMFKLDLKKNNTFTAFRIPVQNGLMQKVIIFCTENKHLHAVCALTKIVQIGWGHHVNFCAWKNRPLLLAKGVRHVGSLSIIITITSPI